MNFFIHERIFQARPEQGTHAEETKQQSKRSFLITPKTNSSTTCAPVLPPTVFPLHDTRWASDFHCLFLRLAARIGSTTITIHQHGFSDDNNDRRAQLAMFIEF